MDLVINTHRPTLKSVHAKIALTDSCCSN